MFLIIGVDLPMPEKPIPWARRPSDCRQTFEVRLRAAKCGMQMANPAQPTKRRLLSPLGRGLQCPGSQLALSLIVVRGARRAGGLSRSPKKASGVSVQFQRTPLCRLVPSPQRGEGQGEGALVGRRAGDDRERGRLEQCRLRGPPHPNPLPVGERASMPRVATCAFSHRGARRGTLAVSPAIQER